MKDIFIQLVHCSYVCYVYPPTAEKGHCKRGVKIRTGVKKRFFFHIYSTVAFFENVRLSKSLLPGGEV